MLNYQTSAELLASPTCLMNADSTALSGSRSTLAYILEIAHRFQNWGIISHEPRWLYSNMQVVPIR